MNTAHLIVLVAAAVLTTNLMMLAGVWKHALEWKHASRGGVLRSQTGTGTPRRGSSTP